MFKVHDASLGSKGLKEENLSPGLPRRPDPRRRAKSARQISEVQPPIRRATLGGAFILDSQGFGDHFKHNGRIPWELQQV